MKNQIKSIIAGIIIGVLIILIGNAILHMFYPPPENFDYTDKKAISSFVESLPAMAYICMIIIWTLSSFVGGFITGKLTDSDWERSCLITGFVLLLGTFLNLILIPHPIWMNIIAVSLYLPLAYLGGKINNPEDN